MSGKLKGVLNEEYVTVKEKVAKALAGSKSFEGGSLPPGQREVREMIAMPPVVSVYPHIERSEYKLRVYGKVRNDFSLSLDELMGMGVGGYKVDFHCVTRWSKLGQEFDGVDFEKIINRCVPLDEARVVVFEGVEGYTANVNLDEILSEGAFVAVRMGGEVIEDKYGGPVRMVVPYLYGWKSTKHLVGIRFLSEDEPGFWETRGYHNHADPWKEERYSG